MFKTEIIRVSALFSKKLKNGYYNFKKNNKDISFVEYTKLLSFYIDQSIDYANSDLFGFFDKKKKLFELRF